MRNDKMPDGERRRRVDDNRYEQRSGRPPARSAEDAERRRAQRPARDYAYGDALEQGRRRMSREEISRRERLQKQKEKKKRRRKKVIFLCLEILLLILVCIGAWGFNYVSSLWNRIPKSEFDPIKDVEKNDLHEDTIKAMKGYTTFAVFGTDSRNDNEGAGADVNMLIVLNNETKEVKLVSVYRDTCVIDSDGDYRKLTNIYRADGVKEQIATLNRNFDLEISDYVSVDWLAVAQAINLMGGLEMRLEPDAVHALNKYLYEINDKFHTTAEKLTVREDGIYQMKGEHVVTYCRVRKELPGGDFARTQRQREVVNMMLAKAKTLSPSQILSICEMLTEKDENGKPKYMELSLEFSEVVSLAKDIFSYEITDMIGFPYELQTEGGGQWREFPLGLADNVKRLHESVYSATNYVPSTKVQEIDALMRKITG